MTRTKPIDHFDRLGLAPSVAAALKSEVEAVLSRDPVEAWKHLTATILNDDLPFEAHRCACEMIFEDWDAARGPAPLWLPAPATIKASNINKMLYRHKLANYQQLHDWAMAHREQFWQDTIEMLDIKMNKPASCAADLTGGTARPRWLVDAELNIVESCFNAAADATAIISCDASTKLDTTTYGELRQLASRVSNGLRDAGLAAGDAIAVDMPMTADAVAIYLGTVQAGCCVIGIADSFAPPQIASRLQIAGAKAIFTNTHINRGGKRLPLYEKVIEAESPRAIVLDVTNDDRTDLRAGDLTWDDFLSDDDQFDPLPCPPHQPINILFSSGTTAEPKAIVWDHTTAIKCAADALYHHDLHEGDVVAWPTSLGWMMGPWLIFAALINKGSIGLYNDLPTERSFGRFVQDAPVNMLGMVPSLVRRWRQTQCMEGLDWSAIKAFSSTGECSNPQDMHYLMYLANYRPIIEYCGGTEIGGGYITSTVVQPNAPATFSTAALGMDVVIMGDDHKPADTGELFIVGPSIGLSTRLLNGDHDEVYFEHTPPGPDNQTLRRHGDQFERLGNGYFRALGRADDTMNLGGIKVSSAEIERACTGIGAIKETAAIAVAPADQSGPQQLVIYAVLNEDDQLPIDCLSDQLQIAIRTKLNPLFKVADVVPIDVLPRTASQKVMRRQLRAQYQFR